MHPRFEWDFGDDGVEPGSQVPDAHLRPFGARYRFGGRTWGIVVWASDWTDAEAYARAHGLEIDGEIIQTFEVEDED